MTLFEEIEEYENVVTGIRTSFPKRGGEVTVIMLKSRAVCLRPLKELKKEIEVVVLPKVMSEYRPDKRGSLNDFFKKFTSYGNVE
jgi:hypothetical protein